MNSSLLRSPAFSKRTGTSTVVPCRAVLDSTVRIASAGMATGTAVAAGIGVATGAGVGWGVAVGTGVGVAVGTGLSSNGGGIGIPPLVKTTW